MVAAELPRNAIAQTGLASVCATTYDSSIRSSDVDGSQRESHAVPAVSFSLCTLSGANSDVFRKLSDLGSRHGTADCAKNQQATSYRLSHPG